MNNEISLKKILLEEADKTYDITEKLYHQVADDELNWKPSSDRNWMDMAQLLMHSATYGCGKAVKGFVRDEWDIPDEEQTGGKEADQHMPPAKNLPRVKSVDEALERLAADRQLTTECLNEVNEPDLLSIKITAPWGGPPKTLFQHLLMMIEHLKQHKGQLFYYLKLMGREVDSRDLWGE